MPDDNTSNGRSPSLAAHSGESAQPPSQEACRTQNNASCVLSTLVSILGIGLCVFTLFEVNFAVLAPLEQLAAFSMLGLLICFLSFPVSKRWAANRLAHYADVLLSCATVACFGYLIWQGNSLANERVGQFNATDHAVAIIGVLLVIEAARRSIGATLPILAGLFLLYAMCGPSMPDWCFPHRGYDMDRIAAQCFLRTEGVFGIAMRVMFTYVFLFVLFGAFLESSGAAQYIIDFAKRMFGGSPGGAAKVSVLSSGLMGSLSGSAVANAATTGAFTIPMMRSSGFAPHIAAGVEAAASSGGALVPPVMGAGAYMMLEIIDPPVEFLEIVKAALLPAILYYFSILLMVHLFARRVDAQPVVESGGSESKHKPSLWQYEGIIFFGSLGALIGFLLMGYTPFRAVTYALELILVLAILRPRPEISGIRRLAAVAALVLITAALVTLRIRAEWVQSWVPLGVWEHPIGRVAGWLQASPDLDPRSLGVWMDSAIPATILLLLLGLASTAWRSLVYQALAKAAKAAVPLVSASACVGIIIGVVNLTGVGSAFPNAIVPLAQESLLAALIAIMVCSIVLGMGLPSAVCYLLMATLIGPVLSRLGVVPLAAHLFIFYFGMMSMVTPPVALAAYATASIANSNIMSTSWAAFRFALVGFTLPYMFVYRPELLLLSDKPEVQASVVEFDQQQANVELLLTHNGSPLSNMEVTLTGAADDSRIEKGRADERGRLQFSLPRSEWLVSAGHKTRKPIEPDGGKLPALPKGEWLEDANGLKIEAAEAAATGRVFVAYESRPERLGRLTVSGPASWEDADVLARFDDQRLVWTDVGVALTTAVLGIAALAAGIAGFLRSPLSAGRRALMLLAAAMLLLPHIQFGARDVGWLVNLTGGLLFIVTAFHKRSSPP